VDIPELRTALKTINSGGNSIEAFEVERFFPSIGQRVMVLNARKVRPGKIQQILLAIEDVTERVKLERQHAIAGEHIGLLLQELTHKSREGKAALERVSHRITALGHPYSKVSNANTVEAADAATYLDDLMPRPDRINT
jgi:hypothetical protein